MSKDRYSTDPNGSEETSSQTSAVEDLLQLLARLIAQRRIDEQLHQEAEVDVDPPRDTLSEP